MERDIKYVLVQWPEIQNYMDNPRYNECFCANSINKEDIESYWFVPEDLYNEIEYSYIELPEEYKNYDLNFNKVTQGQNLLVEIGTELKVVKALSNWNIKSPFPILLDDSFLLDGINCTIIAAENGNI